MSKKLKKAQRQFAEWRAQKTNRREPIPSQLWKLAVELTKTHSKKEVTTTLGLNSHALNQQIQKYESLEELSEEVAEQNHFVEVEIPAVSTSNPTIMFELKRSDGHELRFYRLPQQSFEMEKIIHTFLGINRDSSQSSK